MKGTTTANPPSGFHGRNRGLAMLGMLFFLVTSTLALSQAEIAAGATPSAAKLPGAPAGEISGGGVLAHLEKIGAMLADWLFGWIWNVDWHALSTWGYATLIAMAFLWLTRAPELRVRRLRLGAALVMVLCFWMAMRTRNPLYMLFGLVLLRPVLFLFGLIWSEVVAHYAAESFEAVVYGGDFGKAAPNVSYALPRHLRATKRPRLAIHLIKDKLREKPEDFEGLLLLARIHAEDRKDLRAAAKVVKRALKAETISPSHKNCLAVQYEFWRQELNPTAKPLLADDRLWKEIRAHSRYAEARQHLAAGRVKEAIASAKTELKKSPDDVEGLYLLARIHGEYEHDLKGAEAWAQKILALDYTPSGYSDFIKAMLETWHGTAGTPPPAAIVQPGLVEETLAPSYESARWLCEAGRFGTAIKHAELALQNGNPEDFEGLFLLASIQAERCGNVKAAGAVVERIQSIPSIPAEDKARAVTRLKEWKAEAMALPGTFY